MPVEQIQYSDRYSDNVFEYRHVTLPANIAKLVPRNHSMTETEWRNLGIQQSTGWINYLQHTSEPHVVCFRRPLQRHEP
ncbi:cyclin-dependent kinases regulatory subunit 1-like [Cimex lectularius]|uniref:Cyclin-dependent kinases regulatory subunit n=1 Tax=Cimex lectularius TaxID=79782 RepID=A0A8I6SNL0_CIMLE|nr:cyclin-dependent kinases regulatory subunit 1-like [Cimex lectularius]